MESFNDKYRRLCGIAENAAAAILEKLEEPLLSPCVYAVESGGKRMRPVLFLAVLEAYGKEITENDAAFAAAIEFIHAYSLVHDDLPEMDNDDERRGKPSCHRKFGHAMALLAGDALLNLAFETMSGLACVSPVYAAAMRHAGICSGARGMIAGQALEFSPSYAAADRAALERINNLKTAKLVEAAVAAGAIVAGKSAELVLWIMFASCFGSAFQLKDDLLDEKSDGKSLLDFISAREAEAELEKNLAGAAGYLEKTTADTGFITEFCETLLARRSEKI